MKSRYASARRGIFSSPQYDARLARKQVTLADQQADPNSPLFSAKSFEDLNLCVQRMVDVPSRLADSNEHCSHPNLLKGIYKMGYQKPSKIQEKALPLLLQNPSVVPQIRLPQSDEA